MKVSIRAIFISCPPLRERILDCCSEVEPGSRRAKTGSRSSTRSYSLKPLSVAAISSPGRRRCPAGETLVFDERGMLDYVGPEGARGGAQRPVLDCSAWFVMRGWSTSTPTSPMATPGQEDIDLYSPLEFRTPRHVLRQKVAAAGCGDLLAGRRRADQPVDPAFDPRWPLRPAAGHGGGRCVTTIS
jgi:hypothetical protein